VIICFDRLTAVLRNCWDSCGVLC